MREKEETERRKFEQEQLELEKEKVEREDKKKRQKEAFERKIKGERIHLKELSFFIPFLIIQPKL